MHNKGELLGDDDSLGDAVVAPVTTFFTDKLVAFKKPQSNKGE
jgi:hypothetical protein